MADRSAPEVEPRPGPSPPHSVRMVPLDAPLVSLHSVTPGALPPAGRIQGELWVNIPDKKFGVIDTAGTAIELNGSTEAYLPLTGGTINGNLNVFGYTTVLSAPDTKVALMLKPQIGLTAEIQGYGNGGVSKRWVMILGSGTNEDFAIEAHTDSLARDEPEASVLLSTPFTIARTTGIVNFAVAPTVAGVPMVAKADFDQLKAEVESLKAALASRA